MASAVFVYSPCLTKNRQLPEWAVKIGDWPPFVALHDLLAPKFAVCFAPGISSQRWCCMALTLSGYRNCTSRTDLPVYHS